jgi:N-acetylglucosamine-6-sulfatase
VLGVVVAALLLATAVWGATGARTDGRSPATPEVAPQFPAVDAAEGRGQEDRPNIVFVLTDDQNTSDLAWMPHTRRLLGDAGMQFDANISPHPLCCPARAEMLTGQYGQNNGVLHNGGPFGGYQALDPTTTIAPTFAEAGYTTGLVGKYLNGYGPGDDREPGWDLWEPLVRDVYSYDRYSFFGERDSWREDRTPYVTDAVARRTNAAVRRMARGDAPFLLYSWHVAPHYRPQDRVHGPPPAAARDRDKLTDVRAPSLSKPNYNQADVSRQPLDIRDRPLMRDNKNQRMFTGRVQSLQSVDRAVASLVRTLRRTGELDDTYLVFSSDNGYAMGEHRLFGKNVLTREIMDVPLLVRGPGVAPGSRSALPTSLVDLPATFLDLAGLTGTGRMDGASLRAPLHADDVTFRDTTLVQTGGTEDDGWRYRGVQTERYLYALDPHADDAVLYDHAVDPWELDNVVDDPRYADVVAELERRAALLRDCAGASCNLRFGPDPAPRE